MCVCVRACVYCLVLPSSQPMAPPPPTHEAPPTVANPGPAPPPQLDTSWKEEFAKLREEFAKFKVECLKDIEILTKDLDDERKLRKAMEVDIDRLKKTRGFREVL